MARPDNYTDQYIANSADFAKPILSHLRELVQETCPEVKETVKWSFPHFEYAGSILCSMAAFKQHCAFGFWLGALLPDPQNILSAVGEKTAMGHLGQIRSLADLPKDAILAQYIRNAMELIDLGVKLPKKPKSDTATELSVPDYLLTALQKNKKAQSTFENFSNSQKKEYIDWVTEAKSEETRQKRLATAVEWMEEGKIRNWKYVR